MAMKDGTFKKIIHTLFVDEKNDNDKYNSAGMFALYRKELADQIHSWRFLILMLLIAILGVASIYSTALGIQSEIQNSSAGGSTFLLMFAASGGSIPSFVSLLASFSPIVGLALGFDAINGERTRRTLTRLVAQPIYRDSVINGKFLSGLTVIAVMIYSLGLVFSCMGIFMIGIVPSSEDVLRIILFLTYTVVYISLWMALSMLFSIVFRHVATTLLSGISIWLFLSFFWSFIASGIAGAAYPLTDSSTEDVAVNNYNLSLGVLRFSPSYLYQESVSVILIPSANSLGYHTQAQQALLSPIQQPLPLDQSLLLVWPHLVGLIAITMVCFAISYVLFMRQEIRVGS
jgi:ABC-type transport system involved in multi-copper enzyme maturation, permease component